MVFTRGAGVNHTAWEGAGEDYEAVLPVESVEENRLYHVMVAGGPVDEGTLTGDLVECPWHGSRFRLCDGRLLTRPTTVNAPRYDIRVHNRQVEVKRASQGSRASNRRRVR